MCGVNGIFAYHSAANAPDKVELLATRDAMRARGPDGSGLWWSSDRRCGLGHRRLSILDLSDRASQPMVSADGKLVITFNGEIYNYRDLWRRYADFPFRTQSDTEVIVAAYLKEGVAGLKQLNGMFALALIDERRGRVVLARDPVGKKPLYIFKQPDSLLFGSSLRPSLETAIRSDADYVVLIFGRDAADSNWVSQEIAWAREREESLARTFALPVPIDDVRAAPRRFGSRRPRDPPARRLRRRKHETPIGAPHKSDSWLDVGHTRARTLDRLR